MKIRRVFCSVIWLAATAACADDHSPLRFSVSGDRLVAQGEVDGDSLAAFKDALDTHPQVTTLVLRDVGGSVDDAANVALSRAVRRAGLVTVVPEGGLVASGGTDLFLAGTSRRIERGACVGVHAWAAEDFTATEVPRTSAEHDRYLSYYADMGIDAAFYWFTLAAAPADGMHWMTAAEVRTFGLASVSDASLGTPAMCDAR